MPFYSEDPIHIDLSTNSKMTVDQAIALAAQAHAGQKDKAGVPYILHPIRVMMRVPDKYKVIAVLHDVVEDCSDGALLKQIDDRLMSQLIVLTRQGGIAYEDYIANIGKHAFATCIKIADLEDNMDLRRIHYLLTEKDFARTKKYTTAYHYLLKRRDEFQAGTW